MKSLWHPSVISHFWLCLADCAVIFDFVGLLEHGAKVWGQKKIRNTRGKKSAASGSQVNWFLPLIFFSYHHFFDGFLDIFVTLAVSIVSPGIQEVDEENRFKIAAL